MSEQPSTSPPLTADTDRIQREDVKTQLSTDTDSWPPEHWSEVDVERWELEVDDLVAAGLARDLAEADAYHQIESDRRHRR